MVTVRGKNSGFTLTELMVVVVILSLLAALSTPLFTRDNNARRGRSWAKIVAQTLQRARFEAMGDRANMHVLLYRARIDTYREESVGVYTLIASIPGPVANVVGSPTVAIWDARIDLTVPSSKNALMDTTPAAPTSPAAANDIIFTSLGSTVGNANWRVYLRNELLPTNHPDASFLITIGGLTGFISSNNQVTLP
jgi:prepilin-type N-terminal cleavage/methylation domain-containing protein